MSKELKRYAEMYDEMIDFKDYYARMIPDWDGKLPTNCRLHDDNTPSFSYSESLRVWSCFGSCATSGKVTKYHMAYLKRYVGGYISLEYTLESLRTMFPYLPKYHKELDEVSLTNEAEIKELKLFEKIDFSTEDIIQSNDDSEVFLMFMLPMPRKERKREGE